MNPSSTAPSPSTTSKTSKPSAPPSPTDASANTTTNNKKTSSHTSSHNAGYSANATHPTPSHSAHGPAQHSANESSTGSEQTSTTTDGPPPTPPPPSQIPWSTLSPNATWVLHHIAIPIYEGYSLREIALHTGHTRTQIEQQLEQLRRELTP